MDSDPVGSGKFGMLGCGIILFAVSFLFDSLWNDLRGRIRKKIIQDWDWNGQGTIEELMENLVVITSRRWGYENL
jgi:hypothetical protein